MKGIIAISLAGIVVVLGASQAAPPPRPTAPAVQGPRPAVPTVQTPQTYVPTVQVPQPMAPPVQAPQAAAPAVPVPQYAGPESQVFEGTWSASGQRQTLPTDAGQSAITVQLSGAITITTTSGLSRGFRGEIIGFDDGAGLIAGRVVWTDQRGDRIFSSIFGDALASTGRQMRGRITSGTGRYAGITGEYEFRWQHLLNPEGNQVSGRAADLRGRVRTGGSPK